MAVIYLRPLLFEILARARGPNRPNFIFGAKTAPPLPSGALTIAATVVLGLFERINATSFNLDGYDRGS